MIAIHQVLWAKCNHCSNTQPMGSSWITPLAHIHRTGSSARRNQSTSGLNMVTMRKKKSLNVWRLSHSKHLFKSFTYFYLLYAQIKMDWHDRAGSKCGTALRYFMVDRGWILIIHVVYNSSECFMNQNNHATWNYGNGVYKNVLYIYTYEYIYICIWYIYIYTYVYISLSPSISLYVCCAKCSPDISAIPQSWPSITSTHHFPRDGVVHRIPWFTKRSGNLEAIPICSMYGILWYIYQHLP